MYLLYKYVSYFIRNACKRWKSAMKKIPLGIDICVNSRESRLEDNGTWTITPSLLPSATRLAMPCHHFRHPGISHLVDRQPNEVREPGESAKAVVVIVVHNRGHCRGIRPKGSAIATDTRDGPRGGQIRRERWVDDRRRFTSAIRYSQLTRK